MKNKITKANMTKFDYKARKLGLFGVIIVVLSLAVVLPIAGSVSSKNGNIQTEIQQLREDIRNDNYTIENK